MRLLKMYESDEFVKAYASEKDDHPFRVSMERFSLMHWLGDVQGKRVLDAGCGAGNYSRLLCELGARQVVGIDSALKMIHCAQTMTVSDYPVDYAHQAAEGYVSEQPFDLVLHAYLLNYATSTDHLDQMCRNLYVNLTGQGKAVGIVSMLGHAPAGAITCCDFYTAFEQPPGEGESYHIFFKKQDEYISNINWSQSQYVQSLQAAGFSKIQWLHPITDNSDGLDESQWQELLEYPVFMGVVAEKA